MAGGTLALALQMNSAAPTPAVTPAQVPALARTGAASPASSSIVTPTWHHANHEWLWNPKKGVAFELASLNRVAIWLGQSQPMLVVRCESNRMQSFVFTASAIQMEVQDENHTVRLAFDDEPERTERWADSSDHDALFAPDSLAFARRLTTARVLRFGYTPHNAPHALAEFHVGGLAEVLAPAARQCGWTK